MSAAVEEDHCPEASSIASSPFDVYEREKSIRTPCMPPSEYRLHGSPPICPSGSRPFDDAESLASRQSPAPDFFDPNYDTEITWLGTFPSIPSLNHRRPQLNGSLVLLCHHQRTTLHTQRFALPWPIMMIHPCLLLLSVHGLLAYSGPSFYLASTSFTTFDILQSWSPGYVYSLLFSTRPIPTPVPCVIRSDPTFLDPKSIPNCALY